MIEIRGAKELAARWRSASGKIRSVTIEAMWDALEAAQRLIPKYPPQPPPKGNRKPYQRTEQLGKGLGSGFAGGAQGTPSIYEVKPAGGYIEGRIGSNYPEYNEYVIGENQAGHMGHWWTVKTWRDLIVRSADTWKTLRSKILNILKGR